MRSFVLELEFEGLQEYQISSLVELKVRATTVKSARRSLTEGPHGSDGYRSIWYVD